MKATRTQFKLVFERNPVFLERALNRCVNTILDSKGHLIDVKLTATSDMVYALVEYVEREDNE